MLQMGKISIFSISMALMTSLLLAVAPISGAVAECVPVAPSGKTIGEIKADEVTMPIKAFTYPAGGIMEPQRSTLLAGLSKRHMPLDSSVGSSIITWHTNYNGCTNSLNIFLSKKVGYEFTIKDEKGQVTKYAVTEKFQVTKGDYRAKWFNLIGPRKLVLVTCTGEFKNGHYTDNAVLIARPVKG